ncbi:unnamed protein product, partial [Didymodactylos carnosus]
IRLPGKYVRFRNTNDLQQEKVEELSDMIMVNLNRKPITETPHIPVHHEKEISSPTNNAPPEPLFEIIDTNVKISGKPIDQWNLAEVDVWFKVHNVNPQLRGLYSFRTGKELVIYSECLLKEWQQQYARYTERYARKYDGADLPEDQFIVLVSALRELHVRQMEEAKTIQGKAAVLKPKSTTCEIL